MSDQDDQKKHEPLYQVWVTEVETGKFIPCPCFPRMMKEVVDEFASTMRLMIAAGKEKRYADPQSLLYIGHRNS